MSRKTKNLLEKIKKDRLLLRKTTCTKDFKVTKKAFHDRKKPIKRTCCAIRNAVVASWYNTPRVGGLFRCLSLRYRFVY